MPRRPELHDRLDQADRAGDRGTPCPCATSVAGLAVDLAAARRPWRRAGAPRRCGSAAPSIDVALGRRPRRRRREGRGRRRRSASPCQPRSCRRRQQVEPLGDIGGGLGGAGRIGEDLRVERAGDRRLLDHLGAADLADQRLQSGRAAWRAPAPPGRADRRRRAGSPSCEAQHRALERRRRSVGSRARASSFR